MKYILFVILTVTACWVITSVKTEVPTKEPTREEKTAKESLSEKEFLLPMKKEFQEGKLIWYQGLPASAPNREKERYNFVLPTPIVCFRRDLTTPYPDWNTK